MSVAENKQLVGDAFAAWAGGDGAAFFNLLADDVRWTVIGRTPVSRVYASKREFVEGAAKPLTARLTTPLKPTLRDIIGEGDKLVVQFEARSTGANGKAYDQTYCWVLRLEHGKVREGVAYLDTEMVSMLWH